MFNFLKDFSLRTSWVTSVDFKRIFSTGLPELQLGIFKEYFLKNYQANKRRLLKDIFERFHEGFHELSRGI